MKDTRKKPRRARKKSPNIGSVLAELQNQIEKIRSEDEKGRTLLRDLTSDIKEYLDGFAKGEKRPKESFLKRLQETIDHFAITHPTLTLALSYALTILSNAGI